MVASIPIMLWDIMFRKSLLIDSIVYLALMVLMIDTYGCIHVKARLNDYVNRLRQTCNKSVQHSTITCKTLLSRNAIDDFLIPHPMALTWINKFHEDICFMRIIRDRTITHATDDLYHLSFNMQTGRKIKPFNLTVKKLKTLLRKKTFANNNDTITIEYLLHSNPITLLTKKTSRFVKKPIKLGHIDKMEYISHTYKTNVLRLYEQMGVNIFMTWAMMWYHIDVIKSIVYMVYFFNHQPAISPDTFISNESMEMSLESSGSLLFDLLLASMASSILYTSIFIYEYVFYKKE